MTLIKSEGDESLSKFGYMGQEKKMTEQSRV